MLLYVPINMLYNEYVLHYRENVDPPNPATIVASVIAPILYTGLIVNTDRLNAAYKELAS